RAPGSKRGEAKWIRVTWDDAMKDIGKKLSDMLKKGDVVKKDDVLMVIEAMKMEYLIKAPYNGKVKKVNFKEKDQIDIGEKTVEFEKKMKR
ncbi:MAG TPA: hypothetical protein EYP23_00175, partial [Thermoplasmata archaeon]|nr:hypothetical protein [Thermoplasmata archaeon]